MSKQHYIGIALAIKNQMDLHRADTSAQALVRGTLNDLANDLSEFFEGDNDRFDRHTFKRACGLIP